MSSTGGSFVAERKGKVMGRLEGKVALITGAARGQGRSHAIRLAQEGASIIAVDACGGADAYRWTAYAMSTEEDLAETVRKVEAEGVGVCAIRADVREHDTVMRAVAEGLERFGHLDIVAANAGICPFGPEAWKNDDEQWDDVYGVNLLGVRNTVKAVLPPMIEGGRGGAITVTSSGAGLTGAYGMSDYCATKWGVIGFAKSVAREAAPYNIRVNVIAPGTVNTDMVQNDGLRKLFRPDLEAPTSEDVAGAFMSMSLLQVPWMEPIDISNALLFLSSDEARYITGVVLPVDGGMTT
jgi:(+)-trans-carveol dehydrogenase